MPPRPVFDPNPAIGVAARINRRAAELGSMSRVPVPLPHVTRGLGQVRERLNALDLGGGGGRGRGSAADPVAGIRKGGTTFDAKSGQGRLERTLRNAVADIEEGRANGSISDEDADRYLARAADISEGLYSGQVDLPEWLQSDEAVRAIVAGESGKSALDRVVEGGGNVLTGALREISRPGSAVLSSLTAEAQAGADNPVELGPVKFNRALLGPVVNAALGAAGNKGSRRTLEATLVGGGKGATLEAQATPTELFEATGVNPAARKLGVPVGVVDNPLTHLLTYAATDPLTYIGFGESSAIRNALRAADNAVPGAAAALREGGLEALTATERQALEHALPAQAMTYLKGAQGGIRVRTPFGRLAEGETAIPGKTLRAPLRAAMETAPARRIAGSAVGERLGQVGRSIEESLVPRAALRRGVGDEVARAFDDFRVQVGHTAGNQAQRELDKVIAVGRRVPDLTTDDLRTVTRALDIKGDVAALPDRLRPLGEAFDAWRQRFGAAQEEAGVLIGAEARQEGLGRAVEARQAVLGDLAGRLAQIDATIGKRTAAAEATLPSLEPAARRATEAGYAGGRADVALEAQPRASTPARRAESAADRAFEAQESLQRQAATASERSLERGKKVAQSTRTLQIRKAKLRQAMKEAERELADAEDAFARGVVADEDYFPRIPTPNGQTVMRGIDEGRLSVPGVKGVRSAITGDKFVTARTERWATMSIEEINAEMRPVMERARDLGIIKGDDLDFFDMNPYTAFAQRDPVARRHIAAKQFYENLTRVSDDEGGRVARRLGDPALGTVTWGPADEVMTVPEALAQADNLPHGAAGAREALARLVTGGDEWVFMDVPSLGVGVPPETMLVRREIANEIAGMTKAMVEPEGLVKFMDQWQGLWKAYATVPLPFGLGFHLRNGQGNVFLNWLHGLTSIAPYTKAARLQRAATKGIKQFGDPFALLDEADASLLRQAMDNGVIGEGFFDIDVGRAPGSEVLDSRGRRVIDTRSVPRKAWEASNPLSTDNVLISSGRRLGSSVEHNARLAHFLWSMENLGDAAEAARSVRRALFDYSDLTDFERRYLKRAIPFYTFMRKSAPTVIDAIVHNPSKLSRIQQVRMSLAEDAAAPEGLFPEFLTAAAGVPLPLSFGGNQLVLTPDLPLLAPAESLTDALAVASALPGVPNVTGDTPTEGVQGLAGLVGGGLPGAASTALQVALGRRFFGGTQLSDKNIEASLPERAAGAIPILGDFIGARERMVDGELKPSMTQKSDFVFESLLPLASKIPFGTQAEADKTPRRLLSMLTGLRGYPLGESTRNFEGFRREDELYRYLQSLYDQGLLTKGPDIEAGEVTLREDIEAQVRAELGLDESAQLPAEARAEIERRSR